VQLHGYGIYIGKFYFRCLLHADGILLVCRSIMHSHAVDAECLTTEAEQLDCSFNTLRSVALNDIDMDARAPVSLCAWLLIFVILMRSNYLGVVMQSFRNFKYSLIHVKVKFYRCFSAVYYRAQNAGTETVCVQLLKSICIPALLHATEVLPLLKSDISSLNHVIRVTARYRKWLLCHVMYKLLYPNIRVRTAPLYRLGSGLGLVLVLVCAYCSACADLCDSGPLR